MARKKKTEDTNVDASSIIEEMKKSSSAQEVDETAPVVAEPDNIVPAEIETPVVEPNEEQVNPIEEPKIETIEEPKKVEPIVNATPNYSIESQQYAMGSTIKQQKAKVVKNKIIKKSRSFEEICGRTPFGLLYD